MRNAIQKLGMMIGVAITLASAAPAARAETHFQCYTVQSSGELRDANGKLLNGSSGAPKTVCHRVSSDSSVKRD